MLGVVYRDNKVIYFAEFNKLGKLGKFEKIDDFDGTYLSMPEEVYAIVNKDDDIIVEYVEEIDQLSAAYLNKIGELKISAENLLNNLYHIKL